MPFDPNQPFEIISLPEDTAPPGSPSSGAAFDPNQPFEIVEMPKTGLFNNATAGMNEAIATTAGAPVDAMTWLLNKAGEQARAISGAPVREIQNPIGGSQSIIEVMKAAGVNDPATVQAATPAQQIARAAGAGAGYMLAPEAAIAGIGRAGPAGERIFGSLAPFFGRSTTAADVAGNAAVGAAAGAGGEVVADILPEKYRPLGEFAGNMLGGVAGAGALAAPGAVKGAVRTGLDYLAPVTAVGQERAAGTVLRDASSDPAALRAALDRGDAPLVPGSQPTTFQQTGDMGIGALERAVSAKAPEVFQQRAADQNAARTAVLQGVQGQGHPEAVTAALRDNLAALDQSTFQAVEAARKGAQEATTRMGGAGTPEGYGFDIRQSLDAANRVAKEQESRLWEAVDPTGTLALNVTDAKRVAMQAMKDLPSTAKPMDKEELAIFLTSASLKPVTSFSDVVALRSRVSEAMREELSRNGQTRVYARLSQLRGAIETDIEQAVARKAADEADAVASGMMSEDQTLTALLSRWRDGWREEQASRGAASSSAGPDVPWGTGGFSRARRAAGESGVQFSDAPSSQGISGADLVPNFDPQAADRLKTASSATKQNAALYSSRPVGDVLGRLMKEGPFHVQDSAVPVRFFHAGPTGYEDVQALRRAVSADPGTMLKVRDYAVSTLRKAAEDPDGTLNPEKVERWRKSHADALRAFPEIDKLLSTPTNAAETMIRLADHRKAQIDAFQSGAVARLLGVEEPGDVTRIIGGIFSRQDAATQMGRLAQEVANNPDAKQGLRKAILDHIMTRFVSNREAATTGADLLKADRFQSFLKEGRAALAKVFSPEELSNMDAVAADLKRAERSNSAVKLPGGSNTAQDITAISRFATQPSILSQVLLRAGGAVAGTLTSGPIGTLAGVLGTEAVLAARNAGLKNVDDLVREAMLNPERAKALLAKAPASPHKINAISFVQRFNRGAAGALASEVEAQR
ncbi:MAG: hypothetical protein B7Z30_00645 [Rhizobiales bacterium 12-68-15]|nr:MAG: hypothetical protein B7Z30_00645 [Rhizobiales bacterium 12-68-15]